jgi:hypothetical protein
MTARVERTLLLIKAAAIVGVLLFMAGAALWIYLSPFPPITF